MVSEFVKNLLIQEETSMRVERSLLAIHDTMKSRIPDGVADNFPRTVTEALTDLRRETMPSMPWMSFSLMNDGPNSVNVIINDRSIDKAPVKKGEVLDANMGAKDKIYRVLLFCEKGETANVRIYSLK